MVREDRILMSMKELRRLQVIHQVMERKMTQGTASGLLELTDRQIRRIVKRVRELGEKGIAHRSRGKRSNRAIDETIKTFLLSGNFHP